MKENETFGEWYLKSIVEKLENIDWNNKINYPLELTEYYDKIYLNEVSLPRDIDANNKRENWCLTNWKAIIDEIVFHIKESNWKTCSLQNEYQKQFSDIEEAWNKLKIDKPTTPDEIKLFEQYNEISEKYWEKENELYNYQTNNLEKGLELFNKYYYAIATLQV